MERFIDWLEDVPVIGTLLVSQIMAVAMALGASFPHIRVHKVHEGEKGHVIEVWYKNGNQWGNHGLPDSYISIADEGGRAVLIELNTSSFLIGRDHKPAGLWVMFLMGLPTVILLSPIILLINIVLWAWQLIYKMNRQMLVTFLILRNQMNHRDRQALMLAFQNASRGVWSREIHSVGVSLHHGTGILNI